MSHAPESLLWKPSMNLSCLTDLGAGWYIIPLRFQIISVLLYFVFASGLKFQLLSEIDSHLRTS